MSFQNKFRKIRDDRRGVSLIVMLGALAVLIILATGVSRVVLSFVRSSSQVEQANIAFLAAESGIELALYDLSAFEDGYQTDQNSSKEVCENGINLSRTTNFIEMCEDSHPYRFVNFTDSTLSGGRGFWQLFARTLENRDVGDTDHVIPNPYFVGDGDGRLTADEWSDLTKSAPLSFSLLLDTNPNEDEPDERFVHIWEDGEKDLDIIFWANGSWTPNDCVDVDGGGRCDHNDGLTDDEEEIFTWLFSAIDGDGEEFTLQGVAIESDFTSQECNGEPGNEYCFIFELNKDGVSPSGVNGNVFVGEDINENLPSAHFSGIDKFNRVSGVRESDGFWYSNPKEFLDELDDAMGSSTESEQWREASLTFNLIGTLAETSGIASNALKYKIVSDDEQLADSSTYIISEGFAGNIKQTIQTKFVRESAIPIFSYVIFQ